MEIQEEIKYVLDNRNLGVFQLPLDFLLLNKENERITWQKEGLEALVNSMKLTGGNVTPGICEYMHQDVMNITNVDIMELIESGISEYPFTLLGGNRRHLSNKINKFPTMRVRVLLNLTDEERLEIQFIENATKKKIPPHQVADSYWGLYKLRAGLEIGKNEPIDFSDYWEVPDAIKKVFSLNDYAELIKKPISTIRTAFYYQRVNQRLRKLVETKKRKFSPIAELGRIENKNQQMVEFKRIADIYRKKLSRNSVMNHVSGYLERMKPKHSKLELKEIVQNDDIFRGFSSRLSGLYKLLKKIHYFAEHEKDIFLYNGYANKEHTLKEVLVQTKHRLDEIHDKYKDNKSYQCALQKHEKSKQVKISLLEQVISGEISFDIDEKVLNGLDLSKALYLPSISIDDIFPCKTQPRQEFDQKNIDDMAETIKKFGILQTILVRPKNGKYEIVVGETRYRAAKQAGVKDVDVLVCPMDDITAQIVRIEEDLYEEVILSERAEKLFGMFEMKKKYRGEDFDIKMFAEELGIGTYTLRDAIDFASLDERMKSLHHSNLIGYSHLVALSSVENPDMRFQYAASVILLDLSLKELKEKIYVGNRQYLLPFKDYDHHGEKLKSLKSQTVDLLANCSEVLNQEYHYIDFDDDNKRKNICLMDKLTRKEHFLYLHKMSDELGNYLDEE